MIYLFCGDDNFKSRQAFNVRLKKYQKLFRLQTNEIDDEILLSFNQGLFDQEAKKAVVIENFFSIKGRRLKTIAQKLTEIQKDNDVLIWEPKAVTPAKIKLLGQDCQVSTFKIPPNIFYFLDEFGSKNKAGVVKKLHLALKTHPPELIIYLLEKRLKDLLMAKVDPNLLRMAPWQRGKIVNQVKNLDLEQIRKMYLKLIDIDYRNKTGQLGNCLKNVLINISIQ